MVLKKRVHLKMKLPFLRFKISPLLQSHWAVQRMQCSASACLHNSAKTTTSVKVCLQNEGRVSGHSTIKGRIEGTKGRTFNPAT